MRILSFLLAGVTVYSADLIYIASDSSPKNLESINSKYQQTFLVSDSGVYLIPSECQSERYFGGASEGILNLIKGPIRTETVLTTQNVFEAKDEKEIIKKIELDKTFAIAEGKISKDFLEDKEGRGFGGASEISLVIHNEITPPTVNISVKAEEKEIQHPTCQLLMDGSGYTIRDTINGRLYVNGNIISIVNNTVLFH
ncbi:MAG TPA: hypothetical protein PLM93_01565 [Sulfuricurvum sp.]|nr:MAG: hypothetical protein B7Y30_07660 [Campylobacterales bacterium 16-40-21]OZA03628.1 MAG: hypothetical protein B7X89_02880 [Sulfuricurvum sp. 17-40-25]HQS65857.1 hypothetical protein [Sulfuricurvum sp.]HQT36984.1 hypothetical protein [Sulfuricurvum sp.]